MIPVVFIPRLLSLQTGAPDKPLPQDYHTVSSGLIAYCLLYEP
ncbi:hypothetical protein D1AOALGA4SA_4226 [Olavius algarvensis Delta 1 endosymbiont]|nr:hypothetical protein D1AOALGA4SA_4226 [Olavius algarvensis Delta 1 endosymbiont]